MVDIEGLKASAYAQGRESCVAAIAELVGSVDPTEEAASDKLRTLLEGKTPKEKRKIIKDLRRSLNRKRSEFNEKHETTTRELAQLSQMEAAFTEVNDWAAKGNLTLERPSGSLIHQLRQDIIEGTAVVFHKREKFGVADDYETDVFADCQVFVVEHNWAGAFANAGDYEEGTEFHLPFEVCVFEFSLDRHRVALIVTEMDGVIYHEIAAKTKEFWFLLGMATRMTKVSESGETEGWGRLINFLAPQVKAICVALEAEVAETEVTRAPHKLNRAREKMGRIALSDFHTISLAHRRRYAALPSTPSDEPKTQKRLHFRRGHWRHFETFKTWVRWTLVGNPDLGFVDKDYRL